MRYARLLAGLVLTLGAVGPFVQMASQFFLLAQVSADPKVLFTVELSDFLPLLAGVLLVVLTEVYARGMTLTALSRQVGVSLVNLSVLKNNHAKAIRYATLTAICSALNCSVGDLLSVAADPQATADQNPAPDPEMAQKRAP